MTGNSVLYAMLTMATGIGIPIMASMNATLGTRFQSPALAAFLLCTVGALASLGAFIVSGANAKFSLTVAPGPYYFAGLLIAFYVLSITWVAPKFGLGNAIFFVLLGQLIAASVIDHFGLFGAEKVEISLLRFAGLIVMAIGVFMSRKTF